MKNQTAMINNGGRLRRLLISCTALLVTVLCPMSALAAFTGAYAPENFTLSNTNSDGYATVALGGQGLLLVGGNNGSGVAGRTDYTALAPATGQVQIQWLYGSTDIAGADIAGYLVGNTFTALADNPGDSGTTTFQIVKNQLFGFWVYTTDNTFGSGMLQITSFDGPAAPSDTQTPEPGTFVICAFGLCAALCGVRRSAR